MHSIGDTKVAYFDDVKMIGNDKDAKERFDDIETSHCQDTRQSATPRHEPAHEERDDESLSAVLGGIYPSPRDGEEKAGPTVIHLKYKIPRPTESDSKESDEKPRPSRNPFKNLIPKCRIPIREARPNFFYRLPKLKPSRFFTRRKKCSYFDKEPDGVVSTEKSLTTNSDIGPIFRNLSSFVEMRKESNKKKISFFRKSNSEEEREKPLNLSFDDDSSSDDGSSLMDNSYLSGSEISVSYWVHVALSKISVIHSRYMFFC